MEGRIAQREQKLREEQLSQGADIHHLQLTAVDKNEIFEKTLIQIGGFGNYQLTLWGVGLIPCLLAAFNHLGIIFIAFSPEFKCVRDGISTTGLNENANWSSTDFKNEQCDESCSTWEFDTSVFKSTIVTDFELVCDKLPLLPVIISSYMIGIIVINCLNGFLSDRFGRRRLLLIFSVVHILSSFATAFSVNYVMFMSIHILVGSSIHSVWSSMFVLSAESMPEPKRVANGAVFNFGWNIGALLMTLMAYFLRNWSHLQLAFAVSSLGLISIYFLVLESPRWQLQHGLVDDAETNLRIIASRNRVSLSQTDFELCFKILKESSIKDSGVLAQKSKSFLEKAAEFLMQARRLLHQKVFLKRFVLMVVAWFVVGCSSYGIHFSVKFVEFDIFVVTAVKEVAVLLTIIALIPIYQSMNRAICILIFYLIGGLLGISFLLIPEDDKTARVVVYIMCQAILCGDFYMVDTYTHDLFSTDSRNFAFSVLDAISKIGTTVSPFIVDLGGEKNPGVPPAVFGTLMVVSSLIFLFTPNTAGQALVQTVDELESTRGRTVVDKFCRKVVRQETLV